MALMRDCAPQIAAATGEPRLRVSPFSRSSGNITLALKGQKANFFAKVFAFDRKRGIPAKLRYAREKAVLTCPWQVRIPQLTLSLDVPRLLVTREVVGHGFKLHVDEGRMIDGLVEISRWIAGFHASAQTTPRGSTFWDEVFESGSIPSAVLFIHESENDNESQLGRP